VRTLAITGSRQSPLAEVVADEINLDFADEQSVVQTRFATTALSLLLSVYGWDVEASAERAEGYLDESLPSWAGAKEQFVFLGTGVAAALANEAALKFREILCTWSESYPTMEYRHGPISAINERSLVWILDAQETSIDEQIRATGARVIRGEGDPLAELVRIHRFAEGLADLRGINPDEPPHLTRSIVLTEDR
jgi:fructoselysine-6-P-deglycase FrlB-like protein